MESVLHAYHLASVTISVFLLGVPSFPTVATTSLCWRTVFGCWPLLCLYKERAGSAPRSTWPLTNEWYRGVSTLQSLCSQWGQFWGINSIVPGIPQDQAQVTLWGICWLLHPCLASFYSQALFTSTLVIFSGNTSYKITSRHRERIQSLDHFQVFPGVYFLPVTSPLHSAGFVSQGHMYNNALKVSLHMKGEAKNMVMEQNRDSHIHF